MIPNNNLSVLPWYTSIEQQNARKWWVFGKVYPLFTPKGNIPPFQFMLPHANSQVIGDIYLYDANTNTQIENIRNYLISAGMQRKAFPVLGYDVIVYPGLSSVLDNIGEGRYYLRAATDGANYYSDIFTMVNDIDPYLKLTWWDTEDFVMDAGTIVYTSPAFKNVLYLQADLAKPEYPFEEEGETRDGYFFPVKMISEKKYRFSFLASEYLLDVMRLIRLSDYVEIEYRGQKFSADTFLITPEWESAGDVAVVAAEFDTATVAKKIGVGFIKAMRGDFNDDFNDDFDNL